MTSVRKGIYAASFDPPTNGHVYVIDEALNLFDEMVIAVGTNPTKKPMFTKEERRNMLSDIYRAERRITVITFDRQYIVDVANEYGCSHLVRGVRNTRDCEDELGMAAINGAMSERKFHEKVNSRSLHSTVFIPTKPELALVSSSMVKSLIGFSGWQNEVQEFVPKSVADHLILRGMSAQ